MKLLVSLVQFYALAAAGNEEYKRYANELCVSNLLI
jgi:hypothetical protein